MNDGMVQLNKVTKAYGSFQLDCSMEVQPGMATGFVGANGAGKTTTFQILLGLVPPETGEIRIFGIPYTELTVKDRERLGVSLEDSGFSQFLSVRDVTAILRNLYTRFDEARFLEKCQRYELPANKKIKDFSTGMQAKLKLLIAMSHDADLLILDEWLIRPLPPQESYDMLEIVEARCHKSTIFCTQYESEGWYTRIDPNPESDSPVSEAIMDRIIHNAYEVLVDGRVSMRERKGLKATREGGGQDV